MIAGASTPPQRPRSRCSAYEPLPITSRTLAARTRCCFGAIEGNSHISMVDHRRDAARRRLLERWISVPGPAPSHGVELDLSSLPPRPPPVRGGRTHPQGQRRWHSSSTTGVHGHALEGKRQFPDKPRLAIGGCGRYQGCPAAPLVFAARSAAIFLDTDAVGDAANAASRTTRCKSLAKG